MRKIEVKLLMQFWDFISNKSWGK